MKYDIREVFKFYCLYNILWLLFNIVIIITKSKYDIPVIHIITIVMTNLYYYKIIKYIKKINKYYVLIPSILSILIKSILTVVFMSKYTFEFDDKFEFYILWITFGISTFSDLILTYFNKKWLSDNIYDSIV
jgi:hypothetical protein